MALSCDKTHKRIESLFTHKQYIQYKFIFPALWNLSVTLCCYLTCFSSFHLFSCSVSGLMTVLLASEVLLFTSPHWCSFLGYDSVQCRRAHELRWCPFLPLLPHETSDHQSRCEAWFSPAWGPSVLLPGTGPRRSLSPRPWAFSVPGYRSWLRYELWPSRSGWDSPGAGLWHKTFSEASPVPLGNPSGDPARKEQQTLLKILSWVDCSLWFCVFFAPLLANVLSWHIFRCMQHKQTIIKLASLYCNKSQ